MALNTNSCNDREDDCGPQLLTCLPIGQEPKTVLNDIMRNNQLFPVPLEYFVSQKGRTVGADDVIVLGNLFRCMVWVGIVHNPLGAPLTAQNMGTTLPSFLEQYVVGAGQIAFNQLLEMMTVECTCKIVDGEGRSNVVYITNSIEFNANAPPLIYLKETWKSGHYCGTELIAQKNSSGKTSLVFAKPRSNVEYVIVIRYKGIPWKAQPMASIDKDSCLEVSLNLWLLVYTGIQNGSFVNLVGQVPIKPGKAVLFGGTSAANFSTAIADARDVLDVPGQKILQAYQNSRNADLASGYY